MEFAVAAFVAVAEVVVAEVVVAVVVAEVVVAGVAEVVAELFLAASFAEEAAKLLARPKFGPLPSDTTLVVGRDRLP